MPVILSQKAVPAPPSSPTTEILWNPGVAALTYNQPLGPSSGISSVTSDLSILTSSTPASIPTIKTYVFFINWAWMDAGPSAGSAQYANILNNGTSQMAQIDAACRSAGVTWTVMLFANGAGLPPVSGGTIPAYILQGSQYGNAVTNVTPNGSYPYGWYENADGAAAWPLWTNSNVMSAWLAANQAFAQQWDGSPRCEGVLLAPDDVMYPIGSITPAAYYGALVSMLQSIKSYYSHTNIGMAVAYYPPANLLTLVQDGLLVGVSDTSGASAWQSNFSSSVAGTSASFTSAPLAGATTAQVANGWGSGYGLWGGTFPGNSYLALLSNGQTVTLTVPSSGNTTHYANVNISPAVSSNCPNATFSCAWAPGQLGSAMQSYMGLVPPGSGWTPPTPSFQSYSPSYLFAEEGDLFNRQVTQPLPVGYNIADLISACNLYYNAAKLCISIGSSQSIWNARIAQAVSAGSLTNIGYPSVY